MTVRSGRILPGSLPSRRTHDLGVECAGLDHGRDIQLPLQNGLTGLVLLDREGAAAALDVEAHQVAMDVFAQGIELQYASSTGQRVVELTGGTVVLHQTRQGDQIQHAQSLAFAQGPILIERLEQVAGVESESALEGTNIRDHAVRRASPCDTVRLLLKIRDVEPVITVLVE